MLEIVHCGGCGKQILESDAPNVIVGKNPQQFCSECVKWASIIRPEGDKWKLSPVI